MNEQMNYYLKLLLVIQPSSMCMTRKAVYSAVWGGEAPPYSPNQFHGSVVFADVNQAFLPSEVDELVPFLSGKVKTPNR